MENEVKVRWPDPFKRLYNVFAKINTHLTFLASHSMGTIPSFELIHKLDSSISKLDLAMIKKLMPPGDIFYDYVDENEILLSFVEKVKFDWKSGYKQTHSRSIDDAFEPKDSDRSGNDERVSKQILLFDFRDSKIHGIGSVLKGRKKRKTEDTDLFSNFFLSSNKLSVSKVSQVQLLAMIKKRNDKFGKAIDFFLSNLGTDEAQKDGIELFVKTSGGLIPSPPKFTDPVDLLSSKGSKNTLSNRSTMGNMIAALRSKSFYRGQIESERILTSAREAKTSPLQNSNLIHPDLSYAYEKSKGISIDSALYIHQVEALNALVDSFSRKHVIATTSTSSGKSLIYQLPVLNDILWEIERGTKSRSVTAFFVFPTKALAQDQKRHLEELITSIPLCNERRIIVETFDGDSDGMSRKHARSFADIIFTNPDAIHAAILPSHDKTFDETGWSDFLSKLNYVIMDELHVYNGSFGVHVSYVMSRLLRLISKITLQSNRVTFISCSATIKDPVLHFKTVCGIPTNEEVIHVSQDGSPSCEKKILLWNPPPLMNKRGQVHHTVLSSSQLGDPAKVSTFVPRESIVPESAKILLQLLSHCPDVKVLVFCPIRKICEMMMKEIRSLLKSSPYNNSLIDKSSIMAYRGGYSKSDRRVIERKMFDGQLSAVIATNALELGIDLADIDVVISCGFPMSKSHLHQQFGRAGRGSDADGSLAIFVAGPTPIDQYYLKRPEELIEKSYEDLCVASLMEEFSHGSILNLHLQCAAFEWPIDLSTDLGWFSNTRSIDSMNNFVNCCREKLYKFDNQYRPHPMYLPWPPNHVSLRAIENETFAVVDITEGRNEVIEEVEASRTSFTLYEGGIFLHQGFSYLVREFNSDEKYAKVERVNVDWITQQRDFTDMNPIEVERIKQLSNSKEGKPIDMPAFFGKIEMKIVVFGYFKVNRRSEILEVVEVKNPPVIFCSKGFWIDIPFSTLAILDEKHLSGAGGIHAAQHAIMNILPLFISGGVSTDPNASFTSRVGEAELMTECKAPEKEFAQRQTSRKRPARLIFYDSKGGEAGSGMSLKAFEYIDQILYATYLRVKECECDFGCPQCVAASFCKEMGVVMSKPAAIIILASILKFDMNIIKEEVPDGPEENMPEIRVETIKAVGAPVRISKDVEILKAVNKEIEQNCDVRPIIKAEPTNK